MATLGSTTIEGRCFQIDRGPLAVDATLGPGALAADRARRSIVRVPSNGLKRTPPSFGEGGVREGCRQNRISFADPWHGPHYLLSHRLIKSSPVSYLLTPPSDAVGGPPATPGFAPRPPSSPPEDGGGGGAGPSGRDARTGDPAGRKAARSRAGGAVRWRLGRPPLWSGTSREWHPNDTLFDGVPRPSGFQPKGTPDGRRRRGGGPRDGAAAHPIRRADPRDPVPA